MAGSEHTEVYRPHFVVEDTLEPALRRILGELELAIYEEPSAVREAVTTLESTPLKDRDQYQIAASLALHREVALEYGFDDSTEDALFRSPELLALKTQRKTYEGNAKLTEQFMAQTRTTRLLLFIGRVIEEQGTPASVIPLQPKTTYTENLSSDQPA